jgi:hypothetical protein
MRTWRLLDVYTRMPHIQNEDRIDSGHGGGGGGGEAVTAPVTGFVPTVDEAVWFGGSRSNTTASRATRVSALAPEPLPASYPNARPSMGFDGDIGLQARALRGSHQTTDTIGTLQSIGVAVAMFLPELSSPSEVHHISSGGDERVHCGSIGVAVPVTLSPPLSPKQIWIASRAHEELGFDEIFVVGDGEQ